MKSSSRSQMMGALLHVLAHGMGERIIDGRTPSHYRIGSGNRTSGNRRRGTKSNRDPRRDGFRNKGYAPHGNGAAK